ncbi:MAG TPA: hypothetical protein VFV10_06580 [Gammaproteobacteria bacterium]|nr:hypothetical protein [Gammaproteobacteria bacterium]
MRIEPRPSRWLVHWWRGVHALAAAGVLASALPRAYALLALAGLLVHALLGRPPASRCLELRADGSWAVPGASGLSLVEGTAVGPFWIRLKLARPGLRVARLLLRDQVDAETWRVLQAELRRGGRSGAH